MQTSSRKLLIILAGVVLAGGVVYQSNRFLHSLNFSGGKLLGAVANAKPSLLLLPIFVIYACFAIRALRWQLFQGNLGSSRFWVIYKMTLAGFAAVFILGRAGEPVRPLLLARKERLPIADMFGVYALERLFDFASTAVIGALALILYQSQGYQAGLTSQLGSWPRKAGVVLMAGLVGGIIALVYLRLHGSAELERRLGGWREATGWRGTVARILFGFVRGVQAIRDLRELLLAISYSAVHWFLILLVYYWGTHAFGSASRGMAGMSLGQVMLVMAFSLVGSVIQLPAVGGGAQLAAFIAYNQIFKVQPEPAMAAAVVLWLIGFAVVTLVGVPFLIQEGLSLGKLRELAHEKEAAVEPAQ